MPTTFLGASHAFDNDLLYRIAFITLQHIASPAGRCRESRRQYITPACRAMSNRG